MVFRFSQLHFLSLFSFQVKEKDPTLGCNHEFPWKTLELYSAFGGCWWLLRLHKIPDFPFLKSILKNDLKLNIQKGESICESHKCNCNSNLIFNNHNRTLMPPNPVFFANNNRILMPPIFFANYNPIKIKLFIFQRWFSSSQSNNLVLQSSPQSEHDNIFCRNLSRLWRIF